MVTPVEFIEISVTTSFYMIARHADDRCAGLQNPGP
jgi:hypothetical protein